MFWSKKKDEPAVVMQKMVMVDVWYVDEVLPNVLQSWTWQTVDEAPDFPRAMDFIENFAESCHIHHWHIKEFERPVPNYNPALVHPFTLGKN